MTDGKQRGPDADDSADLPGASDSVDPPICTCVGCSASELRSAIRRGGFTSFEAVAAELLAGTGCTTCRPEVERLIVEVESSA